MSAAAPYRHYRHYADREALLAATASHGFQQLRAALAPLTEGGSPEENLVAVCAEYVTSALAHPRSSGLCSPPSWTDRPPRAARGGHSSVGPAAECRAGLPRRQVLSGEQPQRFAAEARALMHGIAGLTLDGSMTRPSLHLDPKDLAAAAIRKTFHRQ